MVAKMTVVILSIKGITGKMIFELALFMASKYLQIKRRRYSVFTKLKIAVITESNKLCF